MSPEETIKKLLDEAFAAFESKVTSWWLKAALKAVNGALDLAIPAIVAQFQAKGIGVTLTMGAPGTVVSTPPPAI
jgi:hypothetical protein